MTLFEAPSIASGSDIGQADPWTGPPLQDLRIPGDLGDYVAFPSVGFSLRKPADFENVDTFVGVGQAKTQSSVVLVTIAAPMPQTAGGFTQEQMKRTAGR